MRALTRLFAVSVIAATAFAGISAPAGAADFFLPRLVGNVPPASANMQKVQKLHEITAQLEAGKTAYVYSELRAYQSQHVNMVDNEVRCSGAGKGDVVLGENIDPVGSAQPGRDDITIVNRFLVTATSAGELKCEIFVRTKSLTNNTSAFLVRGSLRFASLDVPEGGDGLAMQTHLPYGHIVVDKPVETLNLHRSLGAGHGHSKVAVIADVQYMSCYPAACAHSSTASKARFTLVAKQMMGNFECASAPPAVVEVSVSRQTHHKAVPLYTIIDLKPNQFCNTVSAYVKAEYISPTPTGAIQGEAKNLTDETGSSGTGLPEHDSAMTHIFAVPS